ncbi:hypothetical protein EH31_15065 [Erythrobacter longus]|uniref:Uncharacterized protein n=1 Tax=Erythrobacter longus TaxID=1044 RepID=A0A074MSZ1_ERYLO|nr:hypothetical protein EH31_15065 [Erythrobacter longus]
MAVAAGWFLGRHARGLGNIAGQIEAGGLAKARAAPLASSMGVSVAHASDVRHQTKSAAKARPHVFDDMPPVETVRAQAKSILNSENVWDAKSLKNSPETWEFLAKARVIRVGSWSAGAPITSWGNHEVAGLRRGPETHYSSPNIRPEHGPHRGLD